MKYYSISEFNNIFKLALPIILGLIGQRLLEVFDAAMIGRVSDPVVPLAAAAFGGMLFTLIVIVGFGVCIPVHVLVSQAKNSKQPKEKDAILNTNLWVAFFYAAGSATIIHLSVDFLDYFGQEPAVATAAKPYMQLLGWSLIPYLFFQCFKNYTEALQRPWTPLAISFFGILLNIFLNWIFIYGNWGAPPLGLKGAGLGTLLTRWFMFILLAGIVISSKYNTTNITIFRFLNWKNPLVKKVIRQGIPSASQILFELGLFIFCVIAAGWLGKTVLAAHNITLGVSALPLMFPLGISTAITINVSATRGENNLVKAKTIIVSAIVSTFCVCGFLALILFSLKHYIPAYFIEEASVVSLVKNYFSVSVFLCLPYGLYIMAIGALRGFEDTRIPSFILFSTYFIIGFTGIYILAFCFDWKGMGIWYGLTGSFTLGGILLFLRLFWLVNRK